MRRALPVLLMPIMMIGVGLSLKRAQAGNPQSSRTDVKTTLDGVYTTAQALRGKDSYGTHCGSCHGENLAGISGPSLTGDVFMDNWREDNLNSLFNYIKSAMPPRREKPGADAYLDILTYILQMNMLGPGGAELTADAVESIQLVGKDGPRSAPDAALVRMVGCLTQTPQGVWMLTMASEAIRTRNPKKPTAEEVKASAARSMGTQTFLLVYPESFSPDFQIAVHEGHKMEGRGYLIRNPNDQRLSVTWLEMVAPGCAE